MKKEMLKELESVHNDLAYRNNASTVTIQNFAQLGKDFPTAVSAALLTLGTTHAPLEQTAYLLFNPNYLEEVSRCIENKSKVPGWGSSFVKDMPDHSFSKLDSMLVILEADVWEKINNITAMLHSAGYNIYPNAACYTIATLMATGEHYNEAFKYFIKFRLDAWKKLWDVNYKDEL